MGIFSWLFGKKQAPYADTASGLATLYESFGPRDRAQTYTVYLLGLAYALKELDSHPDEKMKAALGCIRRPPVFSSASLWSPGLI